jgi:hypothetical protein
MNCSKKMVFFIGPVRCGTTWLHEMFKEYTSCSYIPGKEIYFFEKDNADGLIDNYFSKFHHRSNIYVDISPTYFASESVAKKIKAAFPDSVIVIIKRNPAKIAISQYKYIKRNGTSKCTFDEFLSKNTFTDIRKRFMYSVYLPVWKQIFRDDQIIYLNYEDFKVDPVSYFCTICKKISVEPVLKNYILKIVNDSVGKPRLRYVYRVIVWLGRILQPLIGRQRLLHWRVSFFDRILINRSAVELLSEKSLMEASRIFQRDLNYMNE